MYCVEISDQVVNLQYFHFCQFTHCSFKKQQEEKKTRIFPHIVTHISMFSLYHTSCRLMCSRWRWDECINICMYIFLYVMDREAWKHFTGGKSPLISHHVKGWGVLSLSARLMGEEVVVCLTFQHAIAWMKPHLCYFLFLFFFPHIGPLQMCDRTCEISWTKLLFSQIFLEPYD